jgi:hypothetical protein
VQKDFSSEAIFTSIGIEHFIIIVVLLFKLMWDKEPVWLHTFKQRQANK